MIVSETASLIPCKEDEFVVGTAADEQGDDETWRRLLTVLGMLCNSRPVRLLVVRTDAKARCKEVIEHDLVTVVSAPADYASMLKVCDVFVWVGSGVPHIALQAMSLGISTVKFGNDGSYIFGDQAITAGASNAEELHLALSRLAGDHDLRNKLRTAGKEYVDRHYSGGTLWRDFSHDVDNVQPHRNLLKQMLFAFTPSSLLVKHGDRTQSRVSLTVDDGPDTIYTPMILDILRDFGAKSTFFVTGNCAEQHPNLIRRMHEEGHEIGSHSYTHPYFHRLPWKTAVAEVKIPCRVIHEIVGSKCRLFRPPHGKLCFQSILPAWLSSQNVVLWTVDLKDYRAIDKSDVLSRLSNISIRPGDIVLYHGNNQAAIAALPDVLKAICANGLTAVTVSQLLTTNSRTSPSAG
jgi:peptidoglycan-N-acetylglucosamine deacetylase